MFCCNKQIISEMVELKIKLEKYKEQLDKYAGQTTCLCNFNNSNMAHIANENRNLRDENSALKEQLNKLKEIIK